MKNKKVLLILTSINLIIALLIGASYAYFIFSDTQNGDNALVSDCFKIEYTDKNDISLTKAQPMRDKDALTLTPYEFTIKNICNHSMKYYINIETLNNTTMDLDVVKFMVNDGTSGFLKDINDNDPSTIINDNVLSSKTIKQGFLKANNSNTFYLRFWIDKDADIEQAAEKTFESKVVVSTEFVSSYSSSSYLVSGLYLNATFKELAGVTLSNADLDGANEVLQVYDLLKSIVGDNGEEVYQNMIDSGQISSEQFPTYESIKQQAQEQIEYFETEYPNIINGDYKVQFFIDKTAEVNSIEFTSNTPDSSREIKRISTEDSPIDTVAWYNEDEKKILIYSDAAEIYFNENMSKAFYNLNGLFNIDFKSFNTSLIKDMSYMFAGNFVNQSYFDYLDLSNAENLDGLFSHSFVTFDDYSFLDFSNVTSLKELFYGASVANADFSTMNISNITDLSMTFSNLNKIDIINSPSLNSAPAYLKDNDFVLNVSGLNTSNVTNMDEIFSGNYNVSDIIFGTFDTSKVEDMSGMFRQYGGSSLDLSSFNTSNVVDMSGMFLNTDLVNLNLNGWDTSKVEDMSSMFNHSLYLTSLDLSNFNTSKVTTMNQMFAYTDSLTTIDLSGFDTNNVKNLDFMFESSPKLTTIYVGDKFDVSDVNTSKRLFYNNNLLVGGSGTVFNSNYVGTEYAKIDCGTSNPGYFTYKGALGSTSDYCANH